MSDESNALDVIETCHGATIQHGKYNDRIYLMKTGAADPAELLPALNVLAAQKGYGKIFAKVPVALVDAFVEAGYQKEAGIPGFYNGLIDVVFMCKYFAEQRTTAANGEELDRVIKLALERYDSGRALKALPGIRVRLCERADVKVMADIYKQVFPSYPFPITDPEYLLETMESHVDYYGVECEGRLVALSSAEMDKEGQNAEMTDFATLPDYRGRSLASYLLSSMESWSRSKGVLTGYTIARAVSPGMNITFARMGYTYSGRLINNTNISGQIESMNVWYKAL